MPIYPFVSEHSQFFFYESLRSLEYEKIVLNIWALQFYMSSFIPSVSLLHVTLSLNIPKLYSLFLNWAV